MNYQKRILKCSQIRVRWQNVCVRFFTWIGAVFKAGLIDEPAKSLNPSLFHSLSSLPYPLTARADDVKPNKSWHGTQRKRERERERERKRKRAILGNITLIKLGYLFLATNFSRSLCTDPKEMLAGRGGPFGPLLSCLLGRRETLYSEFSSQSLWCMGQYAYSKAISHMTDGHWLSKRRR